jgi:diguanylate cyclase (GGDEF)-like protein
MVDAKTDNTPKALEEMSKKFHGVELELRKLELDKLDYASSIKKLVQAFSLLLGRKEEFTPAKEKLINEFLANISNQDAKIKPEHVVEFTQKLTKNIQVADYPSKNLKKKEVTLSSYQPALANYTIEEKVHRDPYFMDFLNDLSTYRGSRYLDDTKNLSRLIDIGISIHSFLGNLGPLLLRFVRDCKKERQDISVKLSGIIKTLIGLENEFKEFLEKSITQININDREFTRTLAKHMILIQERVKEASDESDPNDLLQFLKDEVETISIKIHQKNEEDSIRLASLAAEKTVLQSSLDNVKRDYDSFVKQSHQMLKELEEMRAVALKDGLTKVFNRRAYDEQLLLTILNFKDEKLETFSLIIFDIDNFRDVNNNYGHQAGDRILVAVAEIVSNTLRSNDFVFRYGGDEFVILLPDANLQSAAMVAEKLRSAVDSVQFHLYKDKPDYIKISISVGVSEVRHNDTSATILSRADKALYVSKNKGRNKVTVEESDD